MSADVDNTQATLQELRARASRARASRVRASPVRLSMAGTIAFLVVLLATTWGGYTLFAGLAKAAASTCFIMVAVANRATATRYGQLILAGLVLSWFGDVFLIGRAPALFLSGLVSFLLAHVAYTAAFIVHGIRPRWSALAALALAPIIFFVLRWLLPHVGDDMKIAVLTYMVVITGMVLFSWGARGAGLHRSAPIGAMMFFVSDIAVTRNRFVVPESLDWLWGLPLYYIAQLFLAYSVVTVIQRQSEADEEGSRAS
ncbi:MAG: lysoplasmalogenase [Candidatus Hydrogenedentes bacterium]|nr:lysoplasmalogenase [Candidatus Hydrogenedentota bacterium]